MQRLQRIAWAVIGVFLLVHNPALGSGEYQGYEAKPQITDIRFTESAIGFIDSNRSRFVPEGPRFFVLERGATDWRQVNQESFTSTFDPAPPVRERIKPEVYALRTSDGTSYLAIGGYCSEGMRFHGGLRLTGSWLNLHQTLCNTPSTVEHVGDALLVGTFYDGEAGNLADGSPLVVIDRHTQQLIKQTRLIGIFTAIRHDPFSGATWVADRSGLYRLDANFESEAFLRFTDQFDEDGDVVTRLNGESDEQYIAQLARGMRIKNTPFLRSVLAGHNNFRLMYGFGMGGWWPDETLALLEPWLINGKLDPAVYELPATQIAPLPAYSPATTTLNGGGYSGKLENFERDNRSRSIVHARWLAWKRLGEGKYERECIATTKTRPSPGNGYFRILPNAWQLEGDWVGAELEVLIPDGGNHALISPFDVLLNRHGKSQARVRIADFLKDCPAPEFSDESLWEDELDEMEARHKAYRESRMPVDPEPVATEAPEGPLLQIDGSSRSIIPSTQEKGIFIVTVTYFDALDSESFRARLNGVDVSDKFNSNLQGSDTVEMAAPRGVNIFSIAARRKNAAEDTPLEIFQHKVTVESLQADAARITVKPVEFDPNRPQVPKLKPEITIEKIERPMKRNAEQPGGDSNSN